MFGFLKKLFAEPKEEVEIVALASLRSWFDEHSTPLVNDAQVSLSGVKSKIVDELSSMNVLVETLRDAKLHNPDIEVREKQFMEGNRTSYIIGIEAFLKVLELPEKTEELDAYLETFRVSLERFTKATVRPYQILQHFFANETGDIAFRIRKLEGLHSELASLTKDGVAAKLTTVKDAIASLDALLSRKASYEKELKGFEETLAGFSKEKGELAKKLEALQDSVRYKDLLSMKADKAILIKQLQEHYSIIRQPFSMLGAALKKYERITLEGAHVISWYLHDAVEAVERDASLQIVTLVAMLQKALSSCSIDLRDKKRQRAMSASALITRELLLAQREKLVSLRSRLEGMGENIANHVVRDEEQLLQDSLSQTERKIEHAINSQSELQESLEKIDIDKERERTARLMAEVFKRKIVIS
ncbi:MAG: hypothetical protein O2779_03155 [Nanoarchaeota archaeon]|nr:hypothetical protein [Nanoarchaeota archaeon]